MARARLTDSHPGAGLQAYMPHSLEIDKDHGREALKQADGSQGM
jgi:hypothetical protein